MDKLEIKQGSFIQQTQYSIPVEIDLSVVPARLGISDNLASLSQFMYWFRRILVKVLSNQIDHNIQKYSHF
jgi:hypothetical protein